MTDLKPDPLMRKRRPAISLAIAIAVVAVAVAASAGVAAWARERGATPRQIIARPSPVRTLLVQEARPFELSVGPIDPELLDPVIGLKPVAIGHHYVAGATPDGRGLAVIGWPSDGDAGGRLQLIDLEAWTVQPTGATVDTSVIALRFAPDGKAMYWTSSRAAAPGAMELVRVAAASGAELARLSLPPSLVAWDFRLTQRGQVAVFAVPTAAAWLNNEPPRVLLIDPDVGDVIADVELTGVAAGLRGSQTSGYEFFRPGIAWDTGRDRLYVVDANEDQLMLIDLADGRVMASAQLAPAQSPLDVLGEWLVPTAYAKVVAGTDRMAIVDPEGRRLYVATMRRTQSRDDREFRELPLGGFVVDTDSLRIVGRIDQPVSDLAVSPDGARVLATGTEVLSRHDQAGVVTTHGVFVLDPVSLDELAHITSAGPTRVAGFSADGRIAYLQSWEDERGGGQVCVIRSLRLDRLEIAAERRFTGYCDIISS